MLEAPLRDADFKAIEGDACLQQKAFPLSVEKLPPSAFKQMLVLLEAIVRGQTFLT